jgi:glycosyltransferase involved in cell wall biosynthesis
VCDVTVVVSLEQLGVRTPGGIATYERELWRALMERADAANFRAVGPRTVDSDLPGTIRRLPVGAPILIRAWGRVSLGVPRGEITHAGSIAGPIVTGSRAHSVMIHDLLWRHVPQTFTPRGVAFHEARWRAVRSSRATLMVTHPLLGDELVADGVNADRVHVVPLGFQRARANIEAARQMLASHGVTGPFTLAVGSVEPRKNHEKLIAAHRRAAATHRDLGPLVIVGPRGWGNVDLGNATYLGAVEVGILAGLYECAKIVAYVPVAEGWGLPVIEALAAGRPVVASTATPSAHDREVALCDADDVDSIADALIRSATGDDSDRARQARRDSVAHLTWAAAAQRHVEVWQCE